MEGTPYNTPAAALRRAREALGVPLRELDKTGRLATGKGGIGTMVEVSLFGYQPNSESAPDLPEAGVEIKVTPYLQTAKGIRAKERLVCNIINYMTEYNKTFTTSDFWRKCNTLLIMAYEHRYDVPKGDFTIDGAVLFRFPLEDLLIIEQDWQTIIGKIRCGQAHLLSEGDTMYLAACTKGATAATCRQQPFSPIPAKQRAYSLKASYMTRILNDYVFGSAYREHIIKDPNLLKYYSLEQYIIEKVNPFYGWTQRQLSVYFGVESRAKNLNELLLARMLGIQGKITHTEEFQKACIVPKTIRIQKTGIIKESMSFPTFDFIELSQERVWEESELYGHLAPTKFLFVIFQEDAYGEYHFQRVKFWNMPYADLVEVSKVWARTVETLCKGVKLYPTPHGISNNLPKQSESHIAHVRPHGKNADDKLPLPNGGEMTKQCFWLNRTYIEKIVME